MVNNKIFKNIYHQLKPHQTEILDSLLKIKPEYNRTRYNELKQLPKKPTISNFRELIKHHNWLISMDGIEKYVGNISKVKLQQFAEQARSLDASDFKIFTPHKRYALMICLLHQSQYRAKNALGTTFCKTMAKMHKKAKAKLEEMKEDTEQKTHDLLTLFSDLAEFEQDLIRERTQAGLSADRARGRLGGRPKGIPPSSEAAAIAAETLYKEGKLSVMQIAKKLSISKKYTL
jgi:hypothetical protein